MTVVHKNLDRSVIVEIGCGYAVAVERSSDARAGIGNQLRLYPFALATSKIPKQ
jgi:hypothetical protein